MLSQGTRLGPYEIESLLGEGGMGEVYKARDTRLDRVVAIKVLPAALASDAAFKERFSREARTISQLAHPNICALYDVGEGPETAGFLVMEFLEGETLAARLERGPLKLEEALKVAAEIVSALDCAHSAGVVHRDLKPGNVMLTRTGAKLLDFGLAKKAANAVTGPGGAILQAATSSAVTAEGMIVGTFQYMAPEQLEGAEADARADIFAFGAILYEMVTGRKAFEGKTPVSLITSILRDEPAPVTSLIPVAPQSLDRLIGACLSKDPDARFRSAHDLALQLRWIAEGGPRTDASSTGVQSIRLETRRASPLKWIAVAAVVLAALAGGYVLGSRTGSAPRTSDSVQFTIAAPEGSVLAGGSAPTFAVSPDGRQVVFVATTPGSSSISSGLLFIRSMGALTVTALKGTERASYPFWSPDSRFVAFFAAGKLKKINVADGSLTELADALSGRGGSWNQDNVILFAPNTTGALARITAGGGAVTAASTLDSSRGETVHRWPHFLPDGRHFLYQSPGAGKHPSEVRVGTLDATDSTSVVPSETGAEYADGHVLFWRDSNVMALPFDTGTLKATGDAFRVAGPVGQQIGNGYASFSVSRTGVLVHARGNNRPTSRLTWLDSGGKVLDTVGDPGEYLNVSLAPDEKRAAVAQLTGSPENRDIWSIDLNRSITSRVTSDPADDRLPLWSPDGTRILFGSVREGASKLFSNAWSGSDEKLVAALGEGQPNPIDWSRDGKFVLYFRQLPKTGFDLMVLPLEEASKPFAFLETGFNETEGSFSPDTKWVAYTSDESGREEIYVQPFPPTGPKFRVSVNGGSQPLWRGDGRGLFFLAPDGTMMSASINLASSFEPGNPEALFNTGVAFTGNRRQYAVTADGRRFLVNVPQQGSTPTPLTVVVNWQPEQK